MYVYVYFMKHIFDMETYFGMFTYIYTSKDKYTHTSIHTYTCSICNETFPKVKIFKTKSIKYKSITNTRF